MKEKRILRALGEVESKYIEEAEPIGKASKKISLRKWLSVAACFALVAVIGIGVFQSGLFGLKTDVATLENGEKIEFAKSIPNLSSYDMDLHATARELDGKEIKMLFGDLPVTAFDYAFAYFDIDSHKMFGLEGEIDGVDLFVYKQGRSLLDTEISGRERNSTVGGIPVKAGYFLSDMNSKGKRRIIYYANFDIGDNSVYVEYAGPLKERNEVKNKFARTIWGLIENGELDFSQIKE